jgi:hypothetical protein
VCGIWLLDWPWSILVVAKNGEGMIPPQQKKYKSRDLKGHDKNLRQVEEAIKSDLKVFLDPTYQIYIRSP